MIIVRTPFRVSLFGGSTDYSEFYSNHGSLLIGFTIDKYNYISLRKTPKILPHKTRIAYSQVEVIRRTSDIKHNGVRGVFEHFNIRDGLEISHNSDIPSQTGLGSSSSFIVGLINGINTLYNRDFTKKELAEAAIYIERTLLKESGGIQDQIWAAYGGVNSIKIDKSGEFSVRPLPISEEFRQEILDRSFLIYTGHGRESFALAAHSGSANEHKEKILDIAHEAYDHLITENLDAVGYLLHSSWENKKKIANGISNEFIDDTYSLLRENGMLGGKLLGAGSSGFIFGIAEKGQKQVIKKIFQKNMIDFGFDNEGSKVIYS